MSVNYTSTARNSIPHRTRRPHHSKLSRLVVYSQDKHTLPWLILVETQGNDLLSLLWPSPPRNILLVKKENTAQTTEAVIEFAKYAEPSHTSVFQTDCHRHAHSTYPSISFISEHSTAQDIHSLLPFPIYSPPPPYDSSPTPHSPTLATKVDLATTFGGDGTILRASSLFATTPSVPPILSFSMGTLGFLNEWKFPEYKRAFRELYMSGAPSSRHDIMSVQDAKYFSS